MRARGVVVAEQHYNAGEIYEIGHTVRFGCATAISLRPAPVAGQHSVKILRELGRSDAEIERSIAGKVVNAVGRAAPAKTGEKHP
jgi:crotonobetainyl-CoA:carnitine CoA-transferase CaiB-like acyl-CoA transferase